MDELLPNEIVNVANVKLEGKNLNLLPKKKRQNRRMTSGVFFMCIIVAIVKLKILVCIIIV